MKNSKLLMEKLADLEEHATLGLVTQALDDGDQPLELLEALRDGMTIVSKRFEEGTYYLPELIMAGEIFKDASDILRPFLEGHEPKMKGKIVFGTVQGDIHDIGKDIVVAVLRGVGFEVYDLGVDVAPQQFVDKVKETGATILGLSGLVTTAYESMKATIEALDKAGLKEKVKIIIGGGVMSGKVRDFTGADAYGTDPNEALRLCEQYIGGN